jgi:hypothetical protein
MLVTKNGFNYQAAPYGTITYIPAGVPVTPATSLPDNGTPQYWVGTWQGMNDKAASWQQNYGFLVDASQVAESPFVNGQRVRILPCGSYPAIKSVRYGIVQGATQHPGMCLINEDGRQSEAGEWAFIVGSYKSPNAGAMWFSAKGLEPMKRV